MARPRPVVQPYRREDGRWDWRLIARNGDIVATSGGQGYTDGGDAIRGYHTVERIILKDAPDVEWGIADAPPRPD